MTVNKQVWSDSQLNWGLRRCIVSNNTDNVNDLSILTLVLFTSPDNSHLNSFTQVT